MDGKKKKNKKKKGNNQNKVQNDVTTIAEPSGVMEPDDGFAPGINNMQKSSCGSGTDVLNVGVSESNLETKGHKVYEDRFVKLQELRQLEDEKNQWVQKKVSMEEKINSLQNVVETCITKEAGLEEILREIQNGNNSIIEKEATLENKVRHIEDIKDSWILKETIIDEVASRLDEVNLRLQQQVKELKESKDDLVQENIQLKESVSVLEARLERMESETALIKTSIEVIREKSPVEEIKQYQPEATSPVVEKREQEISPNIQKVKEVQVESDRHTRDANAPEEHNTSAISSITDYSASNYGKEVCESTEISPSMTPHHNGQNGIENFSSLSAVMDNNPRISEDVVSVPLDDIQVQEVEPQQETAADTPVPITDAPLIGAPFRIISFFTKYVSGADLVEERKRSSG